MFLIDLGEGHSQTRKQLVFRARQPGDRNAAKKGERKAEVFDQAKEENVTSLVCLLWKCSFSPDSWKRFLLLNGWVFFSFFNMFFFSSLFIPYLLGIFWPFPFCSRYQQMLKRLHLPLTREPDTARSALDTFGLGKLLVSPRFHLRHPVKTTTKQILRE